MAKVMRTYRIDKELDERFEQVAKEVGIDKTTAIIEAIQSFVGENQRKMINNSVRHLKGKIEEKYRDEHERYVEVCKTYGLIIATYAEMKYRHFALRDLQPIHDVFLEFQDKYLNE